MKFRLGIVQREIEPIKSRYAEGCSPFWSDSASRERMQYLLCLERLQQKLILPYIPNGFMCSIKHLLS